MQIDYISGGLAVIAAGGQVLNLVLNLQLKNAILESERRIMEKADEKYVHKDVFEVTLDGGRHGAD